MKLLTIFVVVTQKRIEMNWMKGSFQSQRRKICSGLSYESTRGYNIVPE